LREREMTKKEHRVAVIVQSQVVMDITADNNLDSIKKEALEAFFDGRGDQETVIKIPTAVMYFPLLAEGEELPKGANKSGPTELEVDFSGIPQEKMTSYVLGL
jgi:hypothetical protein